jgi:3-keto-L-gulonate-6-phosphate decarboxylase
VWPENWRAFELFVGCRTQWRVGPAGGVLGLDYQGVAAVFRMKRVKDQEAMLADLQVMEAAALEVFNRKV